MGAPSHAWRLIPHGYSGPHSYYPHCMIGMLPTSVRRSRMRRAPRGKRMALTPRDLALFEILAGYRYLNSVYLHAFVGGESANRFKERLGDLFHEDFLDRPHQQWEFADARCRPVVHELGRGARRVLAEAGSSERRARTFLSSGTHRQFAHSVLICETLASIELATRQRTNLRFIPWSEILARMPETTRSAAQPFRLALGTAVIPDGLFGLEYRQEDRKTYRFFALEVDRGTMPVERSVRGQTSYLAKLAAYRAAFADGLPKSCWGLPNLLVLTLTTAPGRLAALLSRSDAIADPRFLFKEADARTLATPHYGLLDETWQRTGRSNFDLSAP